MWYDGIKRDNVFYQLGCFSYTAVILLTPVAVQAFYSIQNYRATLSAKSFCNVHQVFVIRDAAIVKKLLADRKVPENSGKALIQTPISTWRKDPYNASLERATFDAKVDGKTAFTVHDVAVTPRTIIDFLAGGKMSSYQCLRALDNHMVDLVFAR